MNGRTKIFKCSCKHDYQDQKYGPGMRLHNGKNPNGGPDRGWRCTVCSKEITLPA